MNIKEAKKQIKQTVLCYLMKDKLGHYRIPISRQRPVFLVGAPGIGKTMIMEQIAEELGIGLVSYSMTHHTRQSALGLPKIVDKIYGGTEYQVSEYTMSEIIASVYDMMEDTGVREGILFLDEINCVSETLAPSMLQFLQFKTFGEHRVPDGWIIVTAGNPPEYNSSVHEFDIVTLDRLKYMEVEPQYAVWKEYAVSHSIHPAILSYLEIKKDNFYQVESAVGGKQFVTARGWEDLSTMMRLYEMQGLDVDRELVSQYVHHPKIARDFSTYYDLFQKYQSEYQIPSVLDGTVPQSIIDRARKALFDERLALVGMIEDAFFSHVDKLGNIEATCMKLRDIVRILGEEMKTGSLVSFLREGQEREVKKMQAGLISKSVKQKNLLVMQEVIHFFNEELAVYSAGHMKDEEFYDHMKDSYARKVSVLKEKADLVGNELHNIFAFLENAFGDDREMILFVTELTMNQEAADFISHYGSADYFKHDHALMFYERHKELDEKLKALDL